MHRTTSLALRAGLLAIGLLLGPLAAASPPHGRMQPDERERLRQELREQRRAERARAADGEQRRIPAAPAPASDEPSGWANPQQAQPSDPPWRRDASREGMHRGPAPHGSAQRERLSPEERRQLRMFLRERHRQTREQRPDDSR